MVISDVAYTREGLILSSFYLLLKPLIDTLRTTTFYYFSRKFRS